MRRKLLDGSSSEEVNQLLHAYDLVVQLAKTIGDQALEATQHKNKGVVLKERAKFCKGTPEYFVVLEQALSSYQQASEVQGRLGEHEERVKSLRGIAGVQRMLEKYDDAVLACEESIELARACGYIAGVTRAQVVQCEIFLGMVEKEEHGVGSEARTMEKTADAFDPTFDLHVLTRARKIGENLLETEKSKKKIKAGDIARASFIVARIYLAIGLFVQVYEDAELAKGMLSFHSFYLSML